MSRHSDDAAQNALLLFEQFGDAGAVAHYPARGNIPKEAAAIVGAEKMADEETEAGRDRRRTRKIWVTDDPDHDDWPGLSNPQPGDSMVIGDREYVVADGGREYCEDTGMFTLDLVYVGLKEGTGASVRRKK